MTAQRKKKFELPRKRNRKGVDVRGDPKSARKEIRGILKGIPALNELQRSIAERRYVTMAVSADRLRQLTELGAASSADHRELRRVEDRMARIVADLGNDAEKITGRNGNPDRIDVRDRRSFCEKYLSVSGGSPYSLKGREWQQDQFWDPLDGFRLWPIDRAKVCEKCSALVGKIVPSVHHADDTRKKHGDGCRGLFSHVIWLTALQLRRQQGKTTGVAGYSISSLFKYARESIAYITGSEDQSESLFRSNFGKPVSDSPELSARADVQRTRMTVPGNGSEFELRATSLAGSTGGSRTLVIVDEARDVPEEIFSALSQQIIARSGWRCPTGQLGHAWSIGDLVLLEDVIGAAVDPAQARYSQSCTACNKQLEPWHARILAMSSAQELQDTAADWFHNLTIELEAEPQPDTHVFRTEKIINPGTSRQVVNRMETVLGKVKGLGDSIAVEAGGVSRRRGEPFLSPAQISAVEDRSLTNADGGTRPAVGYLDTSETRELTSLTILEDDSANGESLWHRLVQVRIDIWEPKAQMIGSIDDRVIEAHLVTAIFPRFNLITFAIDDRIRPWAKALLRRLKSGPFKPVVRGCDEKGEQWNKTERRLAWSRVDERIIGRTLRLIMNRRQHDELKGARRLKNTDGTTDVREVNRRVNHLDVAEALAGCCLLAHELSVKPKKIQLSKTIGSLRNTQLQQFRRRYDVDRF